MTHQKPLLNLQSVFKNPLTTIGGDQITNQAPALCQPTDESRTRTRTGSDVNDERCVVIEDIDEGGMEVEEVGKEQGSQDDDDYSEEDGEN